jgi:hypothetical protein
MRRERIRMSFGKALKQFAVAFGVAALSSLYATSIGSAQSTTTVRVETPANGAHVNGGVTFTGFAVDCATGQAATRVAVYDGTSSAGAYLADVSMETVRQYSDACTNRPGSAQFGFRLIMDSNRVSSGRHTLAFVAQYPGGASQTTTIDLSVENYTNASGYNNYTYASNYSAEDQSNYWVHNINYNNCYSYYASFGCSGYGYGNGYGYAGYGYGANQYYNSQYPYFGSTVVYNNNNYVNQVPVYGTGVYRPCVVNAWGNCSYYNTYPQAPYSPSVYPYYNNNYNNYNNYPYYWNGYTWVRY